MSYIYSFNFSLISFFINYFSMFKRECVFVVPDFFSPKIEDKVESERYSFHPFPFHWSLTIFPYGKSVEEKKKKVFVFVRFMTFFFFFFFTV
jgi:hypothetical protein